MENPEEVLHSLEEFAKVKPKDIPRELEEYLKFVAKTGDPIYQWSAIKSLFREKLISVITEFYESCSSMEIPPCPNVDMFNYDLMKNFILEKLDTFASAPFTLQRICELLTSPRKEYTRIDKYMRALEKNILVVSTMEPGCRRTENGEGIMNGIESDHEHVPEPANEINVEEMDDSPYVQGSNHLTERISFESLKNGDENTMDTFNDKATPEASTSGQELVCVQYVSIEPVVGSGDKQNVIEEPREDDISVTITAIDVKEVNEDRPQNRGAEQSGPIFTENVSGIPETFSEAENINKSNVETESVVQMDTEPILCNNELPSIENTEDSSKLLSGVIPSSTTSSDSLSQVISESAGAPEESDNETVSPEDSVTSSGSSPYESNSESNTAGEVLSSNLGLEFLDSSESKSTTNKEELISSGSDDKLETDSNAVDSTTKASGEILLRPEDTADTTDPAHALQTFYGNLRQKSEEMDKEERPSPPQDFDEISRRQSTEVNEVEDTAASGVLEESLRNKTEEDDKSAEVSSLSADKEVDVGTSTASSTDLEVQTGAEPDGSTLSENTCLNLFNNDF